MLIIQRIITVMSTVEERIITKAFICEMIVMKIECRLTFRVFLDKDRMNSIKSKINSLPAVDFHQIHNSFGPEVCYV